MCAHQKTAKSVSLVAVEKVDAHHTSQRGRHERAGLVAMHRELERLGEELGQDDPADHREDDQGVAVVGEPAGLGDQPPHERPPDRHQDDDGDDVLHRADDRPERAIEGDRQDLLDDAAGHDVDRPDRQQDEAPEDAGMHQPGTPVLEHLGLDERVLDQADEPAWDVRERARTFDPGRAEDAQVASHREDEDRRRAPEEREDQRVVRNFGEGREQRHRRPLPLGAVPS